MYLLEGTMTIRVSILGYTMGHANDTRDYITTLAALHQVDPGTLRERIEKAHLSLGEIKFVWN